jgi:lipoprotein NlpD
MKNNHRIARLGRRHASSAACAALAALLVLAGCASRVPAPVDARSAPAASQPTVAAEVKDTYVVKSGDTLYSIAREHGMDYRELIALNSIDSPSRITPGRVLKIKPPATASSAVASTAPISSDVVLARPLGTNTETLKREPKAGKEPYSDLALAQAQGQTQGQAKAGETVAPAARTETKPEAKPEVKPEVKPAEPALAGDEMPWIWPAKGQLVGTFSEGGSKGVDIAGKLGDPVIAAADGKIVYSGTGLRGYGKLVIIKHNTTYLSAYAHNQTILVKEGQSVTRGQKIAEMGNSDADQVKLHFEVRRQGKPVDPMKYLPPR